MSYRNRLSAVVVAAALAFAMTGCTGNESSPVDGDGINVTPSPSELVPGDDSGDDGASAPPTSGELSADEAARIATDEYGGTVDSIEDDDHNDRPTWKVELRGSSQGDIEVEVEKSTGEILDVEDDN